MQNIYENKKLQDYQIYSNSIKTDNKEIIKNIEDINEAIYKKKKISFDYYKYELNPTLNNVKINSYIVSPYNIIYSLQELYLIKKFRLDRMKNVNILDYDIVKEVREEDLKKIITASISMYGCEGVDIEVLCDNSLLDNVIEVFGKDIKISKYDNEHFKLIMNKDIDGFKYYVLRNIEFIKIIKPQKLKDEIKSILKKYLEEN